MNSQQGFSLVIFILLISVITIIVFLLFGGILLTHKNTLPPQPSTKDIQKLQLTKYTTENNSPQNLPKNKIIFYNLKSIGQVSLDGKIKDQIITSDNIIGFAGFSRDYRYIYYSELIGNSFHVFKKGYPDGQATELFSFKSNPNALDSFNQTSVQFSSDDNLAAYSGEDGLYIFNIKQKTQKKILNNLKCGRDSTGGLATNCYDYHIKSWSPDNSSLLATKYYYTSYGYSYSLVDPFNPNLEKNLNIENLASALSWSPDSEQILINSVNLTISGRNSKGGLWLITDLKTLQRKDLVAVNNFFDNTNFVATDWKNEKLAFIYSKRALSEEQYPTQKDESGIGIYNSRLSQIESLIDFKNMSDTTSELKWLPDMRHLLLSDGFENLWLLDTQDKKQYKLPVHFNGFLIEVI